MSIQNFIRDFQSRFGSLLDVKVGMQRTIRNLRKIPFEAEFKILDSLSPKGRCVIDVGANRGQSIDAVQLVHPITQIQAFEPNKILFDKLSAKFQADENLVLHNIGLGKSKSKADLFTPYYRNFMYDGLSSFSEAKATNWLSKKTVWRFDPSLLRVECHPCKISTLDEFSLIPFFLKVHVQGFELEVLQGAEQTLLAHKPVLLMANNKAADLWLRERGWSQFVLKDGGWIELKNNSTDFYNSVYLQAEHVEHAAIIRTLY